MVSNTTLANIPSGSICLIKDVKASGVLLQKLLDMGFVKQAEIQIIREAPLYDPMELRIKNSTLALRKSEASLIEVELK